MIRLGSTMTSTFSGYVLFRRGLHKHASTETAPPVCVRLCELLAGYYGGQANPAPVFRAVKQLEAHKLLTS